MLVRHFDQRRAPTTVAQIESDDAIYYDLIENNPTSRESYAFACIERAGLSSRTGATAKQPLSALRDIHDHLDTHFLTGVLVSA